MRTGAPAGNSGVVEVLVTDVEEAESEIARDAMVGHVPDEHLASCGIIGHALRLAADLHGRDDDLTVRKRNGQRGGEDVECDEDDVVLERLEP